MPFRTGCGPETDQPKSRQRLDKWLWIARVVRTRSAAAKLVSDGYVRINSRRVENPAKPVVAGDVVTVALERHVRVLRVIAMGVRRGSATQAHALFEELPVEVPRELPSNQIA